MTRASPTRRPVGEAAVTCTCDIAGCRRAATVEVPLGGIVRVAPRDTDADPAPLCSEHARAVLARMESELTRLLERMDPNRNRSNRAMAGEDLGDAEER